MFKPETLQNSLAGGKQSHKSENIQDPHSCFTGNTVVSKEVLAGMMQKQLSATLLFGISEKKNTALKLGEKTSPTSSLHSFQHSMSGHIIK